MALGMALGLLFLGGGRATLKRTNGAIAALLAAVYPRFPSSASDNMYHAQALRHLYVLAVDYRGVQVRDVDTGDVVYVPLEVAVAPPNTMTATAAAGAASGAGGAGDDACTIVRLQSPCLLPEVCWRWRCYV
jgi:hypothetical protein